MKPRQDCFHPRGAIKEIPIGSLVVYEYNTELPDGYALGVVIGLSPWIGGPKRYHVYWFKTGMIGMPGFSVLNVAK